ncbi:hypothetical protein [Gimesia maris]|uniref:Zinc finger/thioredoxin putative domain-containing protein n=1 Tax=Gimesia maris TaxID=122 RepID=A0ABX5YIK2_9PLAN|nr:hypothetical protein [Gimesia maris]EDL56392.1 hypothetical protein PM8797T_16957 [Gimesia maris DSM 8797]QEG15546.1 hypothetical protein GmarT_13870 [Gimesia maris]QGQ31155.1 hypothetical protein F1729_22355 [Gimesia maris]
MTEENSAKVVNIECAYCGNSFNVTPRLKPWLKSGRVTITCSSCKEEFLWKACPQGALSEKDIIELIDLGNDKIITLEEYDGATYSAQSFAKTFQDT